MLVVFLWAIFLVSFILSFWFKKYEKVSIFIVLVFYTGIKLMYMFPNIVRSGMWIHMKLAIVLLVMGINLYLIFKFLKKDMVNNVLLCYFITVLSFVVMYVLVFFKPF